MLEISNSTPFAAAVVPAVDADARENLAVVIKGTFVLGHNSREMAISEEQIPVVRADEYYGEPGASSVKHESDTCLPKTGCDVVLIGHAYPRRANDRQAQVSVSFLNIQKTVRVLGNRFWQRTVSGWEPGSPEPFERMPLVYERAFGGWDVSNPAEQDYEPRNPVGTGFVGAKSKAQLETIALPNIEDPSRPITSWKDRPEPAGFGFIARNWMPRASLAGTYDEKWQASRCPQLPADFDNRYFNAASPGMVAPGVFRGGEEVLVSGAHWTGDFAFRVPERRLAVTAWIKGQPRRAVPALDTVIVEPDEGRVLLLWRAAIPCNREFLYISNVFIKETAS